MTYSTHASTFLFIPQNRLVHLLLLVTCAVAASVILDPSVNLLIVLYEANDSNCKS